MTSSSPPIFKRCVQTVLVPAVLLFLRNSCVASANSEAVRAVVFFSSIIGRKYAGCQHNAVRRLIRVHFFNPKNNASTKENLSSNDGMKFTK